MSVRSTKGKVTRDKGGETLSSKEINAVRKRNRAMLETVGMKQSAKNYGNSYHLVTSINIDTPYHAELFNNMLAYSAWITKKTKVACHIHIIPTFYRTGDATLHNDVSVDHKYIRDGRLLLNKEFEVICDADVLITNINPLAGMQIVGETPTAILPSPRIVDIVTGSVFNDMQRHLLTTLTIGKPKYRRGAVGTKAIRHHGYGFVVIEPVKKGKKWYAARHVTAQQNGSFEDIFIRVDKGKIKKIKPAGLVVGDLHGVEMYKEGIAKIKPYWHHSAEIITHDTFSFKNHLNHHEKKKPLYRRNERSITEEILETRTLLTEVFGKRKIIFADSNHDDSLSRWLDYGTTKEIPTVDDERLWHELHLWRIDNPKGNLMTYLFGYKVLNINDNPHIHGWATGHHGHAFGASVTQRRGYVGRSIGAHTHQAMRRDGNVTVGNWLIPERPEYARKSPFNWSRGDAWITANGKLQLLRVISQPLYSGLHLP